MPYPLCLLFYITTFLYSIPHSEEVNKKIGISDRGDLGTTRFKQSQEKDWSSSFLSIRSFTAKERFPPFLVGLILKSNGDNVEALSHYKGSVDIFGDEGDAITLWGTQRPLPLAFSDKNW